MNSRAKGRIGHDLTKKWLEKQGWLVYVCPHLQITWQKGKAQWGHSGWNDAFAVDGVKGSGFDILAFKFFDAPKQVEVSFFQVKKTRLNPITNSLKEAMIKSCECYKIPFACANIIWWPDGVGLERGKPVLWNILTPEEEAK